MGRRVNETDHITAAILRLFGKEREDAMQKLADGAWGLGNANAGHAVGAGVSALVEVLDKLGEAPQPLSLWLDACARAKEEYLRFHEDEDGFGVGTIVDIENGLRRIVKDLGCDVCVSPGILRRT